VKRRVVGTAGHIDHGKTSLVRALTGIDCDRLPEEKARGITIDLGFASFREDDLQIGFVDVPGHERFVRNMLAGVGGIDAVMLVIAADESIKPQTREHFEICRLLRVQRGLIVLTKIDLVDPEIVDLVRLEAEELVAGTFLEGAPVLGVSSTTGEGIEELRAALLEVVREADDRDVEGKVFRLPIDRAFTLRGFGSIVTGTTVSGRLEVDQEVEILPSGLRSRARAIQVHSEEREEAVAGERTSVNLADVSVGDLERGQQLTERGRLRVSSILTVELEVLPGAKPVADGARVRFHHYSEESIGRIQLLARKQEPLRGGERGFAQIRLERGVVAVAGDRFVIRSYSPSITIGGGVILDPHLPKLRRNTRREILEPLRAGSIPERLVHLVRLAGLEGISVVDLEQRTGYRRETLARELADLQSDSLILVAAEPRRWIHHDRLVAFRRKAMEFLGGYFERNRTAAGASKSELVQKLLPSTIPPQVIDWLLGDLQREKIIVVSGDLVDVPGRSKQLAGEEGKVAELVEREFREAGLAPPSMFDLTRTVPKKAKVVEGVTRYLVKTGTLVRLAEGLYVHRDTITDARETVAAHRGRIEDVAFFKDLFGLTRKVAIPLLEYFDQEGLTRRVGDRREIL
jgi:selenocysteine-specific elongation factor